MFKSIWRCSEGVRLQKLIFHFPATNVRSKVRLTQNTLSSSMFGNMFSESPLASPKRLGKMQILGRKSHQKDGFESKIRHFFWTPRSGSGGCSTLFFNVFWCPEGPGTSWEWFWMIFGSIIFTSFFLIFVIFWVSNVGCQNTCSKAVLGWGTLV